MEKWPKNGLNLGILKSLELRLYSVLGVSICERLWTLWSRQCSKMHDGFSSDRFRNSHGQTIGPDIQRNHYVQLISNDINVTNSYHCRFLRWPIQPNVKCSKLTVVIARYWLLKCQIDNYLIISNLESIWSISYGPYGKSNSLELYNRLSWNDVWFRWYRIDPITSRIIADLLPNSVSVELWTELYFS